MLDGGKGRVREAVEAARDGGSGALHAAARHGRMPVCVYLVEQLRVNIDAADDKGALFRFAKCKNTQRAQKLRSAVHQGRNQ